MPVKSFQGVRKSQKNARKDAPIRVRDYMTTKLITFRPEQSVEEAIDLMVMNQLEIT